MKHYKCEHCKQWTDGDQTHCEHCGGRLRDQYHRDMEERRKNEIRIPIMKLDPEDSLPTRIGKHLIRYGQLIFLTIISIIASIASSTVH